MTEQVYQIRGRMIDRHDLDTIRGIISAHWDLGRTAISRILCEQTEVVAFFMIHTNRSQAAFEELIGVWEGILVSDGYRIYQKWVHLRQTCLAHLIRRAKGLA